MLILNQADIQSFYGIKEAIRDLIPALKEEHAGRVDNPARTVLDVPEREAKALYMPSNVAGLGAVGAKVVTVFPQNPNQNLPTIQGVMILSETETGQHIALLDASYLTRVRTGALTGIAADRLARGNASRLGVIGTGGMAPDQIRAIHEVRPLTELRLYNLTADRAEAMAEALAGELAGVQIRVENSAEALVEASDMVVCATASSTPVFDGNALQAGTFVSGIGSFLPTMRELDETTIRRASKVVLDTHAGCREEAGELIHADKAGFWRFDDAHSDLAGVVAGAKAGRETDDEIIFFKCVGAAYFDLAVGLGAYHEAKRRGIGAQVDL